MRTRYITVVETDQRRTLLMRLNPQETMGWFYREDEARKVARMLNAESAKPPQGSVNTKRQNRITQEGWDAWAQGMDISDCPYEKVAYRIAWKTGWKLSASTRSVVRSS